MPRPLIAVALLLAGCGADHHIVGNAAPDARCAYSEDERIERGTLDVALRREYRMAAIFSSTEAVDVVGAEIMLLDDGGAELPFGGLPNPFTITVAAHVPANRRAIGGVEVIPSLYGEELAAGTLPRAIRIEVIAFGDDGEDFEPFDYVVDVCEGCLLACTSDPIASIVCEPGMDIATPVAAGSALCP